MISRFEMNVQTGERMEIAQTVYVGAEKEVLVLDDGEKIPQGFSEYTGDLKDLDDQEIE